MTLDQLEMFEAVVEAGSFKSASERIHKSQPSISMGIRKLEDEFGFQLFSRDFYRAQLTEQGKSFYRQAKGLLQNSRSLTQFGSELGSGIEPKIKIALDPLVSVLSIQKALKDVFENRPEVRLELDCGILTLETFSDDSDIDLAIGFVGHFQTDQLEFYDFAEMELVSAISKLVLGGKRPSEKILKGLPQIFVETPTLNFLPRFTDGRQWRVSDHSLKESMILSGMGWGRLPSKVVRENSGILTALSDSLVPRLRLKMSLIRRRDRALGPVGRELWNSLLDHS